MVAFASWYTNCLIKLLKIRKVEIAIRSFVRTSPAFDGEYSEKCTWRLLMVDMTNSCERYDIGDVRQIQ